MIRVNDLSFTYERGTKPALEHINLHIPQGDFVGIIGESGAGKTTLTSAINGLIPHHYKGDYYGSVVVCDKDTFELPLTDLSRMIGTVSQDIDSQMVAAVVEDEMLYGLENFGIPREHIENRMVEALDAVGIGSLRNRRIATLSGGQKQKVAIAAILALKPSIIVLDEPTGELDPVSSKQIFELLRALNNQGVTVVVVEQKVMLLCEYAKHIVVMDHAQVVLQGSVAQVLSEYKTMERIGINCPQVATLCDCLNQRGLGDGRIVARVSDAEAYVREVLA